MGKNGKYPCIVKGVWYDTIEEAKKTLNINAYRTQIHGRFRSQNPDYIYLKELKGKKIPNDPVLMAKLAKFNAKLLNLRQQAGLELIY